MVDDAQPFPYPFSPTGMYVGSGEAIAETELRNYFFSQTARSSLNIAIAIASDDEPPSKFQDLSVAVHFPKIMNPDFIWVSHRLVYHMH